MCYFSYSVSRHTISNGNISNATLAINQLGSPVGYTYHYDQLNRLKKMRQHTGISGTSWDRSSITLNYQENATYDGNGNILTYGRNGAAPTAQTIDSLTYNYPRNASRRLTSNQLQNINDAIANSNYTGDLTNQTNTTNYRYDAIGNLIYDAQSNITGNDGVNAITWSVYGKIQNIYKTTGTINYTYDPSGQRVSKTAGGLTTYYIRDAQGNTLAIYDNAHSNLNWKEQQLYGSSRLGLWAPNENLSTNNAAAIWDTTANKQYELTNHLGNVLATITDKRLQHTTDNSNIDYYLADVSTAQDYYPFGMLMPGRQYSFFNVYRYGFNGKENDNDVKGVGNQQDYGERIYDPRVGRFLSVDPVAHLYPELSPYQFASDRPIDGIDMDGEEFFKKDNTDYHWYYLPVLKTATFTDALKNGSTNTLAFLWNGTFGSLLSLNKDIGNYLFVDGWQPNTSNPIDDAIDNTFHGLDEISNTPIKRQVHDLGVALTDLNTYEVVPQLFLFHELSTPLETPKATYIEKPIDDVVPESKTTEKPSAPNEAYNRKKHYGNTPTSADRKALNAKSGQDLDHTTPLVKHYYEGDEAGSKPGHQMTDEERKKYANDRTKMKAKSSSTNRSEGGKFSQYSKNKKKEYNLGKNKTSNNE